MSEAPDRRATRDSYDTIAEAYAAWVSGLMAASPYDRAVLGVLAERVGGGRVLDVGCGTGRVTAHLADLGCRVEGVDLSPGMIAVARRDHPGLSFAIGDATALTAADDTYDAALAWYSLIHLPPVQVPTAIAELVRVVRPGGRLVLAFQTDADDRTRTEAGGHEVDLTFRRLDPARVRDQLAAAGADVESLTVREPDPDLDESTRQAYVVARVRDRG